MRKVKEFAYITPIQIAVAGYSLNFVSNNCFQNLLEKIWYQNILPDNTNICVITFSFNEIIFKIKY